MSPSRAVPRRRRTRRREAKSCIRRARFKDAASVERGTSSVFFFFFFFGMDYPARILIGRFAAVGSIRKTFLWSGRTDLATGLTAAGRGVSSDAGWMPGTNQASLPGSFASRSTGRRRQPAVIFAVSVNGFLS